MERKQTLEKKMKHHEKRIREINRQRYDEQEVKQTLLMLKKRDKTDSIERMKRIEEFNRLQTLQKIKSDDARTMQIVQVKKEVT